MTSSGFDLEAVSDEESSVLFCFLSIDTSGAEEAVLSSLEFEGVGLLLFC